MEFGVSVSFQLVAQKRKENIKYIRTKGFCYCCTLNVS